MKTKHLRLMQRVYIILFFCFMYLPIAYMIVFSFNQSKGYSLFTGFTFKWYRSLFTNASILHALWVSPGRDAPHFPDGVAAGQSER